MWLKCVCVCVRSDLPADLHHRVAAFLMGRLTWPFSRHASLQHIYEWSSAAETYVLIHTPAGFDAFGARVCICEARAAGKPRGHQINIINSDSMESNAAQSAIVL